MTTIGMVAITGNTFPVRAQLAAMGGKWDKGAKAWMVPADKAEAARAVVNTSVATVAKASGKAYYVRVGEGWGVCSPGQHEAGSSIDVMTKSGKVKTEIVGIAVGKRNEGIVYNIIREGGSR